MEIFKPSKLFSHCKSCGVNALCLPASLPGSEIDTLSSIIRNIPIIKKGQTLFSTGEKFEAIYAIKSGAFKSFIVNYEGEQQITSFHLPGDVLGLDSITAFNYNSSAVALCDSLVCKIPFRKIEDLNKKIKGFCQRIMCMVCKELVDDQKLLLILGQKNAEEKMAAFIINLSLRYKVRKLSHLSFSLIMSRSDLSCYLGLTVETVSRIFKKFKHNNLINIKGRNIDILDYKSLIILAGEIDNEYTCNESNIG